MQTNRNGTVTLVGAGCSKGLMTQAGEAALRAADVIVYDDLIDQALLTAYDCEKIYVGKRHGQHSAAQTDIQNLLIEKARAGAGVVRLKGGDSFVFGRGGEEALALQAAGIPFDVIPGVTSAVAVPAHVGIPVTHRGLSQSFTVVTGHSADSHEENYAALAALEGTLIFLMGLHNLEHITTKLIANGKERTTPASLISCGFSPEETRIDGTLETIAALGRAARSPAILVVGAVASLHLQPQHNQPRITVVGTEDFCRRFQEKLPAAQCCPCLRLLPLQPPPDDLSAFEWLAFTSANGVSMFFERWKLDHRKLAHLHFACIGTATAARLRQFGFDADLIPADFTAAALGTALAAAAGSAKILILRAAEGSDELLTHLKNYMDIKLYRSEALPCRLNNSADYIVFASAGGVRAFFSGGNTLDTATPVCIGASTAAAIRSYTYHTLIAGVHTIDGVIATIQEDFHATFSKVANN